MENALKLVLKKDVFEGVKNGDNSISFETTSYYMNRFTSSKTNTVDDLKNDNSLFKSFDGVSFSCGDEKFESEGGVSITLSDDETPMFIVSFKNESQIEHDIENDVEHVNEDVVDTFDTLSIDDFSSPLDEDVEETPIEEVVEINDEVETVEPELQIEVEEDEINNESKEDKNIDNQLNTVIEKLNKFIVEQNVYVVTRPTVKISHMGKVWGCDKRLPIMNTHDYDFNFKKTVIDVNDFDTFTESIKGKGFIFLYVGDSGNIEYTDGKLEIMYATLTKLTAKAIR
ncbi:MAG: hypothetical protein NC548_42555 [Lachnospiraceae bacterium]|nr:hypothetical protein [Lachnospiraceae bacterium]